MVVKNPERLKPLSFNKKSFCILKKVYATGIAFTVILLFLSAITFSQSSTKLLRNGNKLYEQGKFNDAEKNYRRSLELDNKSVKGKFNLGDAVYKQKNFSESAKIFNDLTGSKLSKSEKAQVYHNLGNSLLEAKEFEKSIAAYKNSLVMNPSDKDTKYNLEYAKMMLKQQQQQQQQQQNQDKKDQDKKDDKNQEKQQDQQNKDQKQDKQDKSQEEKKISKEDAERMLEALKNDEKKTMQKVEKKRVQAQQVIIEKDW